MSWSHILVEGYCLFDKKKHKKVPECCINGSNKIGFNCLIYNEEEHRFCPFLGLSKSKSTIALNNIEGKLVTYDTFELEDNFIDEKEWLYKESQWIKYWKKMLNKEE